MRFHLMFVFLHPPRPVLSLSLQTVNGKGRVVNGYVELAEADAKRRKQDASAEGVRVEAVTILGHPDVEVPDLRRSSRQQAIAAKTKVVASEGERTTTANAEGGQGGRGGLGRGDAKRRGSDSNSGRRTVRGARW
ncbi:hypothetical protein FN846DRAFT_896046 [Sphaerosporella brunnea]|uniref:Uncharacterized protein n=1 Tax=Sphaerosporella brunnea TaxID=1250544 RepID=A0A5J5EEG5_9PEZI|nr:hypothetical protein FN846DRAFT_896046 [Sphaerosporella brunnea]